MATSGQLIEKVACALGIPEATITTYYRSLREAGLVSKAGRGPNAAAKKTPRDAASLLMAVAGSSIVTAGAEAVREYSILQSHSTFGSAPVYGRWRLAAIPALEALPPKHSFTDALVGLIEAASDGSLREAGYHFPAKPFIQVVLCGPYRSAWINIGVRVGTSTETHDFQERMFYSPSNNVERSYGDLRQERTFHEHTIFAIGEILKN